MSQVRGDSEAHEGKTSGRSKWVGIHTWHIPNAHICVRQGKSTLVRGAQPRAVGITEGTWTDRDKV